MRSPASMMRTPSASNCAACSSVASRFSKSPFSFVQNSLRSPKARPLRSAAGILSHSSSLSVADAAGAAAAAAAAAPAASATLSELEWLKIPAAERKGLAFGDLSEFWTKLKGLFEKREATELQAAQLLALGVRIMDAGDRKKLALLEKLGHVALANNAVKLR